MAYVKTEINGETHLDYSEGPPPTAVRGSWMSAREIERAWSAPRRPSLLRRILARILWLVAPLWPSALRRLVVPVALVAIALSAGCHTVSAPALTEAHTAAAVGDGVLTKWDTLTDAQKKTAVQKLTRAEYSVLNSADGTEIPAQYAAPATTDAVTTRSSGQ